MPILLQLTIAFIGLALAVLSLASPKPFTKPPCFLLGVAERIVLSKTSAIFQSPIEDNWIRREWESWTPLSKPPMNTGVFSAPLAIATI